METSELPNSTTHQEQEESQKLNIDEHIKLLTSLPREKGWWTDHFYQHQGFWFEDWMLKGILSCQRRFVARDTDIILITPPKSGTTWLKALIFTLVNRNKYPTFSQHHPLVGKNPHDLVPFLEGVYLSFQKLETTSSTPRILSTHSPLITLPKSLLEPECKPKLVYLSRDPKDVFTSLWHYVTATLRDRGDANHSMSLEEAFDMFSKGISPYGPFWDHVLDYWNLSRQQPGKILFMRYEEMKEEPVVQLRRLAEFLEFPFSQEEEASGVVEDILRFCSIDNLREMEVNKSGKWGGIIDNNSFFRKGKIGDWKNLLSPEMAGRLDLISTQKFQGSGLIV